VRLYLVRHAEANANPPDPERHLSPAGREQVRRMAAFLRPLGLKVWAIWHSPKARAAETAAALAEAVRAEAGCLVRDDLGPNNPIGPVRRAVEKAEADVMIVGHLPMVEDLAAALLVRRRTGLGIRFTPGAVLCLEHNPDSGWNLAWMVTPDLLRPAENLVPV